MVYLTLKKALLGLCLISLIIEMGSYACLHCFSIANSWVRLLITCAHPDYMHFFLQFLSCLFTYYLCWIYVLEVRINIIIIAEIN